MKSMNSIGGTSNILLNVLDSIHSHGRFVYSCWCVFYSKCYKVILLNAIHRRATKRVINTLLCCRIWCLMVSVSVWSKNTNKRIMQIFSLSHMWYPHWKIFCYPKIVRRLSIHPHFDIKMLCCYFWLFSHYYLILKASLFFSVSAIW